MSRNSYGQVCVGTFFSQVSLLKMCARVCEVDFLLQLSSAKRCCETHKFMSNDRHVEKMLNRISVKLKVGIKNFKRGELAKCSQPIRVSKCALDKLVMCNLIEFKIF